MERDIVISGEKVDWNHFTGIGDGLGYMKKCKFYGRKIMDCKIIEQDWFVHKKNLY